MNSIDSHSDTKSKNITNQWWAPVLVTGKEISRWRIANFFLLY